jgi:ligand-binding sensor domain-containing protein
MHCSLGIFRRHGTEWTKYGIADGLLSDNCKRLVIDDEGIVWTCSEKGISKFDGTTWINFVRGGATSEYWGGIYGVTMDKEGGMWCISTVGPSYYNGSDWSFWNNPGSVSTTTKNICVSSSGTIYTGISDRVDKFENGVWSTEKEFPDGHYVYTVNEDQTGRLWVSGRFGFLARKDGDQWNMIQEPYINYDFAKELEFDSNSNLYFPVVYTELFKYDGTSITEIELEFDENIYGVEIDSTGTIWVLQSSGISKFDGNSWSRIVIPARPSGDLAIDPYGCIWYPSDVGIYRYDGVSWSCYTKEDGAFKFGKGCTMIIYGNQAVIWNGYGISVLEFDPVSFQTGVKDKSPLPSALSIKRASPNPFNPSTTISIEIPNDGFATISIYNINGQKIRDLATGNMTAGTHSVVWDGRNDRGEIAPAGVYITRARMGNSVAVGKMLLLK